jgi:hypothetical protein
MKIFTAHNSAQRMHIEKRRVLIIAGRISDKRACSGVQAKQCEPPGPCQINPGTCDSATGNCTYEVRTGCFCAALHAC